MKNDFTSSAGRFCCEILGLGLVVAITSAVFACDDLSSAQKHPYEGFTRPYRSAEVAASDFARVDSLHVAAGDEVQKNQLLIQLDATVLEVARRKAAAIADADSSIRSLQVEYDLAQRRAEKLEELNRTGGGSKEEIQRAIADARIAEFRLQNAKDEQRSLSISVEEIDARIQSRRVFSPFQGVVTEVVVEEGEFVSSAAPEVCTIVDLSWLRTTLFLPTIEATRLKAGTELPLRLVETRQAVNGVVERVGKVTLANSGRTRVELLIANPNGEYRSGLRCQLLPGQLDVAFTNPQFGSLPTIERDLVPMPKAARPSVTVKLGAPEFDEPKKPKPQIAIVPFNNRKRG